MRSSLNTLRMDIFLNSAILNPFVLLFILHDCREEGLLEDLQPPPQRAKMGAVLNFYLSGNHDEDRCLLVDVVDHRWV